jgi:hypothetical protein
VSRTGSTAAALTVNLTAGGTATLGSDYGLAGNIVGTTVTIPTGSVSAVITLNAVDDADTDTDDPSGPNADGELAILSIAAGSYTVGTPSAAQVEIIDNDGPP